MMEVEREKKDKLAAARKKLNEYKQNRLGAAGRSNPTSVASSQPADVPLFYQNINSPAGSINIFNPAAANNNFVPNPSFVPVSSSPVTPSSTVKQSNDAEVESLFQPNFNYPPKNSVEQTQDVAQLNPFLPSTSSAQRIEEPCDVKESQPAENNNTHNSTQIFLPPSTTVESQSGETVLESPATQEQGVPLYLQGEIQNSLGNNVSLPSHEVDATSVVSSKTEFLPSAPDLEQTNTSQNAEQLPLTNDFSSAEEPNQHFMTENSSIFTDATQPDNMENKDETDNCLETPPESNISDTEGAPIKLFASSLFESADNKFDSIFNFGGSEAPTKVLSDVATVHTSDNITNAETIPQGYESVTNIQKPEKVIASGLEETVEESRNYFNPGILESENMASVTSVEDVEEQKMVETNDQANPVQESESDLLTHLSNLQHYTVTDHQQELNYQHQEEPSVEPEQHSMNVSNEMVLQMRSVQDALELQIEELRRENAYLLGRQTELTTRIEESEKLAHEFKLEKDRVREEANTTSQALRARINSLCEENQRIVKNSTDVGVDLRAKLEEKSKQLEEMQKAVIIVSQSKMDFAGRLDHELERVKELESLVKRKDDELNLLRTENAELQEKLKQNHQRDAVIHQLQDQARHYQVQCETLQKELTTLRNKILSQQVSSPSSRSCQSENKNDLHRHDSTDEQNSHHNIHPGSEVIHNCTDDHSGIRDGSVITVPSPSYISESVHSHQDADDCKHHNDEKCSLEITPDTLPQEQNFNLSNDHHCGSHDDSEHRHHLKNSDHVQDKHQHHHDHCEHDHHDHHGDNDHHHDHHLHGDNDHHHDHHHHNHPHPSEEIVVARRGPSDELTEIKKTLHRLEWENSSYRNEIDILAVDAKQKRTYEEKCSALEQENQRLKKEVEQLEHVIIQLQGENDTIGDYITLYQTQKMALKECAKEKDAQLELLAREREMLLHRLAELTALVKDLKESKSEAGSQCADDHMHTLDSAIPPPPNKRQIEGKIRDLLTEISSSSLIENFHPCAVCSGRLMTV